MEYVRMPPVTTMYKMVQRLIQTAAGTVTHAKTDRHACPGKIVSAQSVWKTSVLFPTVMTTYRTVLKLIPTAAEAVHHAMTD